MKELKGLLEQLASQLGTTVEHLWGVMLRQAPYSAILDIIQYIIIAIAVFFWWKMAKTVHRKIQGGWDEILYFGFVGSGLILLAFCSAAFFSFPDTITKIVNPEYWAFMKIMEKLK